MTRKLLLLQESSLTIAWYLLAFTAPLCILPMFVYGWITPDSAHLPWLLLLGILGALAHYTFNRAYALSDITFLLPFGAAKIILCSALSYAAFLEIPATVDLWLGISILTLSTIVLSIPSKISFKLREAT